MPLAAPELSEANVESGSKALLAEWLARYFDGEEHTIGVDDTPVEFPKATIEFDQGPVRQPLAQEGDETKAEIRIVARPGRSERGDHPSGCQVFCDCQLQFFIRSKVVGGGEGNSNSVANTVADLLLAILNNPVETADLSRKGMTHFAPRKAEIQSSKDYKMRMIGCPCQLIWVVNFRE